MSVPVIALFHNKGGVGKTTLAYHLVWKLSDLGIKVIACGLDPQANLTAAFLSEDELEDVWENRKVRAFKVISGFWRVIQRAAAVTGSDIALVDLGPTLGAINRAALVASDSLVIPVAPDLFRCAG